MKIANIGINNSRNDTLTTDISIKFVGCTSSTNHELISKANLLNFNTVVTGHQSAGRGRANRSWYAPANSSLLMSTLLPVPTSPEVLGLIPLAAGLAVVNFLTKLINLNKIPNINLKWPNDVLIEDKKVAGILTELTDNGIIIGIGINLTAATPAILNATSVSEYGWENYITEEKIPSTILVKLAHHLVELIQDEVSQLINNSEKLLTNYKKQCITLNNDVSVKLPNEKIINGYAQDINDTGELILKTKDGLTLVNAGDVNIGNTKKPINFDLTTICKECR
ncbi:MAG: biotin--[acetyl-CoA-carboxylase] ligase [Micrococcaceae bacterium]